jgi:hypothetical protein
MLLVHLGGTQRTLYTFFARKQATNVPITMIETAKPAILFIFSLSTLASRFLADETSSNFNFHIAS